MRSVFQSQRLRSLLLLGSAATALLVGAQSASADDLVFDWTGGENGTSFASAGNWAAVYDADGNLIAPGPPTGEDDMNVVSGTPNISSKGRHVRSVNLSGGEFIVTASNNDPYPVWMMATSPGRISTRCRCSAPFGSATVIS